MSLFLQVFRSKTEADRIGKISVKAIFKYYGSILKICTTGVTEMKMWPFELINSGLINKVNSTSLAC